MLHRTSIGIHWQAALSEFVGTAALLLGTLTAVRWLFGSDSAIANAVPGLQARLAIVGVSVGTLLVLLIRSPVGRRSGGHFNPAVTVSFWLMGALPAEDVAPYLGAQLLGSVAGTGLASLIWGPALSGSAVAYGVIQPAGGATQPTVFLVEAGSIVILMAAVAFFLARPALAGWTPWVVGAVVAVLIAATGPWTGGSFNPARQLGPAWLSGETGCLLCYLVGPVTGAAFLGAARRLAHSERAISCQLCGT